MSQFRSCRSCRILGPSRRGQSCVQFSSRSCWRSPARRSRPNSRPHSPSARHCRHSRCRASTARPTRTSRFKDANILVMVFTCAHCPTAQAYQERIKRLVNEYSPKGVKLIAINPNHADSVRLDELAYTDLSDSFEEMQERAKQEKFNFVWLDDGPKQELSHEDGAGGDAARVHLRQGAQASLRRPHRRLRARVLGHQARHARGAGRAGRRQGTARHLDARLRLFGEMGRQGGRVRQVQGALGQGAGDPREGGRRDHQGHSCQRGYRQAALHQRVGDMVRTLHHGVR